MANTRAISNAMVALEIICLVVASSSPACPHGPDLSVYLYGQLAAFIFLSCGIIVMIFTLCFDLVCTKGVLTSCFLCLYLLDVFFIFGFTCYGVYLSYSCAGNFTCPKNGWTFLSVIFSALYLSVSMDLDFSAKKVEKDGATEPFFH